MQRYSFRFLCERIRYRISDSLSLNKTAYVIYFISVIAGVILGVLWGKDLPSFYEINVKNEITLILYEGAGIFSAFLSRFAQYLVLYLFCLAGVVWFPFIIIGFVFCGFISFIVFRGATCLIVVGGIENILCAILFHALQNLIFFICFSYVFIKAYHLSKNGFCNKNLSFAFKNITPSFLFALLITAIYSVIVSIMISFFAI